MQSKRTLTALASAVALAACGANTEQAAAPTNDVELAARTAKAQPSVYVVRMIDPPVTAYTGGINGLRATKPAPGTKIDPNASDVVAYVRYLDGRHDAALGAVGGRKLYDYRFSFNGFSARLTPAQAKALAKVPGVLSVDKDEIRQADTVSTPSFLGLNAEGGLWAQLGGVGAAGEGVIIGIVDSGIWPESASFSDRVDGKRAFLQLPGWHGRCVPGEGFTAALCNQKLIGAQYFNAGLGGNAAIDAEMSWEFNSVRDYNGHGSHTAATAGGNANVALGPPWLAFGDSVSGMAPRARIAAYKALWSLEDASQASGSTADLVAAIDQAVADGVDVINYSVSGSRTNFRDPVEIAFMYAADAGIFVAASAGNSGPTTGTVAHPGPWLTTVAAGTHNRDAVATLTLGDGSTFQGSSTNLTPVTAPFIDATAAALPGADATMVALCYAAIDNGGAPVLDPAKVAGKIVLCDRGTTARVNKSLAVKEAGGVGMVLVNVTAGSVNADFHAVPSVHLAHTHRTAVKAYAATSGATATIGASTPSLTLPAPFTASFSSRGPLAASGDLLKPDLIAPGQDILAAVSPVGNAGLSFNLYSGTSMSSPHVAGLAALLKDLRPTWSPMMIKSALMTTADDILDGPNTHPLVVFRQGAGHVAPNRAADPGLVYDSRFADWLGFLCGTQLPTSFCANAGVPVLDPSDFNGPSIAFGDLLSTQTITRRVTNVGAAEATYTSAISGLVGFTTTVTPASLTLAPGETKTFQVTVTRTTAALNDYTAGYLTWSDGTHRVRSPVVVRPVAIAAPAEVALKVEGGSYDVAFGYTGSFTATARGLVPATVTADTVADDPTDSDCSLTSPNAKLIPVTIPAGITYARFSLFDADVTAGSDLDLCVFRGTTLVGLSAGATAAEQISFANPPADSYTVVVQGWGVTGSTPFKLHTWLLGTTAAGNMTVSAPATATTGAKGTIDVTFGAVDPATKYLGSIVYGGVAGMPPPTIVRLDVP